MTTWIQGQYPIFSVTVNHQYGFSVSHTLFHHIWWSEGTRDLPKNDITISHLDKSSIWSVYNDPHQSLYSRDWRYIDQFWRDFIKNMLRQRVGWLEMMARSGDPPETHLVLVLIAAGLLLSSASSEEHFLPKLRVREEQSRETVQPLHTSLSLLAVISTQLLISEILLSLSLQSWKD